MYVEWTSHLQDPEEKIRFEKEVQGSKRVLQRLYDICDNKEHTIDRSETNMKVYDSLNWSVRQAHKNGNREMLWFLKKLVDLDQQRTQ